MRFFKHIGLRAAWDMRDGRVGAMTCVRLRYANRTYRAAFDVAVDSAFDLAFDSTFDFAFDLDFESAFDLDFDSAFDVAFESNSHVALPIVRGEKWIRKVRV
jgi:hypothetical protein